MNNTYKALTPSIIFEKVKKMKYVQVRTIYNATAVFNVAVELILSKYSNEHISNDPSRYHSFREISLNEYISNKCNSYYFYTSKSIALYKSIKSK